MTAEIESPTDTNTTPNGILPAELMRGRKIPERIIWGDPINIADIDDIPEWKIKEIEYLEDQNEVSAAIELQNKIYKEQGRL